MIRKVKFGNATIQYSIIKSNRRKTSQITVDKDSVVVRTPISKSISEIKEIVDSKKQWIFRKRLEFQKRNSVILKPTYIAGSKLLYLGRSLTLKILKNRKTDLLIRILNIFELGLLLGRGFVCPMKTRRFPGWYGQK